MPGPGDPWWWALLVSLLSGFVGAGLTTWWTWARRPKLRVSFNPFDVGVLVDTPATAERVDGQGRTIEFVQRALRLRIENHGETTAHQVNVSMIEFCYRPRGVELWEYMADEVLELHLALAERALFDLPPKGHRWVDLAYADQCERGSRLRFGFAAAAPNRLALMGFGQSGLYSAAVVVTAANAEATPPTRIHWEWGGGPREDLTMVTVRRDDDGLWANLLTPPLPELCALAGVAAVCVMFGVGQATGG
jgi:hypothetical protein